VAAARPRPDDALISSSRRSLPAADPRSALATAALAAAAVGLLGTDAGILWLVAGVWATRAMAGGALGSAWGIAAIGAGLRWGTLGFGDLEVATRIAGPTLLAGPLLVRGGMILALLAALTGEAQTGGLVSRTWGERGACLVVMASIAPLFVVRGPGAPVSIDTLWWPATAAVATGVVLLARPLAGRVQPWIPPAAAAAGIALAVLAS
jgi:hypothetical protein